MGDLVKIGVKTALIVGIMAAALLLLGNIQIPAINTSGLVSGLGTGLAILNYYAGNFSWLITAGFFLLSLKYILIPTFKVASIIWRWIMKVNE